MVRRLLLSIFLVPVGLYAIAIGGWFYAILLTLFIGMAAREYVLLFRARGHKPSEFFVVGGTLILLLDRAWHGFTYALPILSLLILVIMAYHLLQFERGREEAAVDFAISLGGVLYIGWLGAYMISIRQLPDGEWWTLMSLPGVWLADSGAYLIGSRWGKHWLAPRLSPKKTWEGYIGGIIFAVILNAFFTIFWWIGSNQNPALSPWNGALMGLIMGIFPTLGDLGESMIKRMAHVKDSSQVLPGMGGMFDRIDSWLWGGVIAYYLITWLWVKL
jgi:phosphatidate cytidylyltransferase